MEIEHEDYLMSLCTSAQNVPKQYERGVFIQAERSRFIAVYGRRRVGKTFLVRETFNYTFTFQHAGLAKGKISA